ncbi:hypothetical protein [Streptomyces sp. NBC_01751]|uniref:hypothetical protein n=1 Tax=Streptomyces sp. NBC_01751 TaxID=2975929 RepID=UPI002DD7A5F7|nr:hypothetical protein [Streptomyces sp. NBC_01751]WSD24561.1 hypothetical protein OHA26_14300 [Streptomyces sp. NBC_01751]
MSTDPFWIAVRAQLTELETAKSANEVVTILSAERNPYGHESIAADGFFAGGDGDNMRDVLEEAGWGFLWSRASYWYAMQAPDGSVITYVEGDIYLGDRR